MGPFASRSAALKDILATITSSQNAKRKTVTIMVFDPKEL